MSNKLLMIGWDGADWDIIRPLMDSGKMPALQSLVSKGSSGLINTLNPPLSPMLWTSIATGKRAYDHGILNFTEPDADTKKIRPVTSSSRKVKAVWDILSEKKLNTHLIGWWPSHPAEEINGICVSDYFIKSHKDESGNIDLIPDSVYPDIFSKHFKDLYITSDEITPEILYPFVNDLKSAVEIFPKGIAVLTEVIAATANIHSTATWILENKEWDFTGVYFSAIDKLSHMFMKFCPPRMKHIPDNLFAVYKDVVSSIYRFHDMMLARYLDLAGEETTIILVSDHGFKTEELRYRRLPKEPAAPAYEHSEHGIFVIKGPDIKQGHQLYGTSLLDITPTILHTLNLPCGKDMDGRAVTDAFISNNAVKYISSWEETGKAFSNRKTIPVSPWAHELELRELVALGYVEDATNDEGQISKCVTESQYNLAVSLLEGNYTTEAIAVLESIFADNPEAIRFGIRLFNCYLFNKDINSAERIFTKIKNQSQHFYNTDLLGALLDIQKGNLKSALTALDKIRTDNPSQHYAHFLCGNLKVKLRRPAAAETDFLKALELNERSPEYLLGLARCYRNLNRFEECTGICFEVLKLKFNIPEVHKLLGFCFEKTGNYKESAQAYELFLAMKPEHVRARKMLADIYESKLDIPEKSNEHQKFLTENEDQWICVVSGLPRSGTSLVMQLLEKGGFPFYG